MSLMDEKKWNKMREYIMYVTKNIRVEAIEDIRSYVSGISAERYGHLIAKKGRQGWIDECDVKMLSENYLYDYVYVLFDGNKIRRHVPNKSLRTVMGRRYKNEKKSNIRAERRIN